MSIRGGRSATRTLTASRLVLAPRHGGLGKVVGSAVAVAVLCVGAAGAYRYLEVPRAAPAPTTATVPATGQLVQQRLEQTLLKLELAEARGHELERQVDALNQKLRQSEDELTFFRKARTH